MEAVLTEERTTRLGTAAELGIFGLIWLNIVALVLESVAPLHAAYGPAFVGFERFSIAVFTVEYGVRLWRGGLRFATRPLGLVDLLAILPFYLPAIGADLRVLRIVRTLRVFRLLRVAKLARYSVALQMLGRVVVERRAELVSTGAIMLLLMVAASTIMYHVENGLQPDTFSSIPATMWWAVSTMTTVGYGDVYPVTAMGRLIGAGVAVLGIAMFALPTSILGAAFLEEYQRARRAAGRCPHCGR
jgi:voltage-gated potassium channel